MEKSGTWYGKKNDRFTDNNKIRQLTVVQKLHDCWICIDVGKSRALCPTCICVVHGSPLVGKDLIRWDIGKYYY
jgi:hypothetical protein